MEASAIYKYARISPQKCRLVADTVRGLPVEQALTQLSFLHRAGSPVVYKALHSAVHNAVNKFGIEADELHVKEIRVNKSLVLKRWLPRAKGRASPKLKRSCHVYVVVSNKSK
ncbi:MAG: 50S ribosomal protein L22 [Gammaproteobacteria bacterium]|nr:50S ribosomal protein L22 [Pseudomonadota bacterium]MCH9662667.1 50S ribosomal protein L22 [Gammaproteobacteria bacterium]